VRDRAFRTSQRTPNDGQEQRTELTERVADQETARVVAIRNDKCRTVGAGCLISSKKVMTCKHVVKAAIGNEPLVREVSKVAIQLIGVPGNPSGLALVIDFPDGRGHHHLAPRSKVIFRLGFSQQ